MANMSLAYGKLKAYLRFIRVLSVDTRMHNFVFVISQNVIALMSLQTVNVTLPSQKEGFQAYSLPRISVVAREFIYQNLLYSIKVIILISLAKFWAKRRFPTTRHRGNVTVVILSPYSFAG